MSTPNITALQPYLFFNGRCEEAIQFYQSALGAEVEMLMRFNECPETGENCTPAMNGDKVMHAALRVGGTTFMASDGRCGGTTNFDGFGLSLSAADEAVANNLFTALSEGGAVQMPLGKTFYSPCFGMVEDKFGVLWMVIVQP